jgi:H/ACA ribonucleoprotein complex subunit 3
LTSSILYCENCKEYTLKQVCPRCGSRTVQRKPPKYSPEDKYADYRRQAKEELESTGSD